MGGGAALFFFLPLVHLQLAIKEEFPAFGDLQAAGRYILGGRRLGMNGLELALHGAGGDQCGNKADEQRNCQTPHRPEGRFGQGIHIIGASGLCLGDKAIAKGGVGIKGGGILPVGQITQ